MKTNRKQEFKYSDEALEVCVAWIKGEITISQLSKVLKYSGGNGLYAVAKAMRLLYDRGKLTFKK